MKLEEGMYVRTKNGIIFKYYPCRNNEYDEELNIYSEWDDDGRNYDCYTIANANYNIIDLIEENDILMYEYENKICISKVGLCGTIKMLKVSLDFQVSINCVKVLKILTKEQYENNCYKLEE